MSQLVNTIIFNFGISDRLYEYVKATYTNAKIREKSMTHIVFDVSAMTKQEQGTMRNDLISRLIENL